MAARLPPSRRADYPLCETIASRWADNDVYGHVNNAAYYTLIDSAVNRYMIVRAGVDIHSGPLIALVVETGCRFHHPLTFPQHIDIAMKVARLGVSSVTWHIALFESPAGAQSPAAADAHFTHVLVDRATRRPEPWPDPMRDALTAAMG
ncbi:acyl-CoA thioesterase [Acuticoccus kandeliae]|uniref:acyl-CoA thioesterase n=1 Tax=Acuticoccus kandeliae TaxID=2073160 RepID=UPI000D3EB627|nr:thioesterase family protein [Acuticoccus kandeliae]